MSDFEYLSVLIAIYWGLSLFLFNLSWQFSVTS